MTYDEAMARYGSDRPDIRFGLEIADLGEALAGTEFKVFSGALGSGGVVRGLNAGAREVPRKDLDALTEHVRRFGAGGLVWAFVQEDGTWRSPIAKFLTEDEIAAVTQRARRASPGDLLLIVADTREGRRDRARRAAARALAALRASCPPGRHEALWVVDFPMFEYNEGERRWDALHHPFTTPTGDFARPGRDALARPTTSCSTARRSAAGRSVSTAPRSSSRSSACSGSPSEEAEERFGFLLDALRYGAPPHGGIALGHRPDRRRSLAGRDSIRDVIAFPKTASGSDPLTGAPAPVDAAAARGAGREASPLRRRSSGSGQRPIRQSHPKDAGRLPIAGREMSQISPPIRILLIAVVGLMAAYMLFLRPKTAERTPAPRRPPRRPAPRGPGAATASSPARRPEGRRRRPPTPRAAKVAAGEAPGGRASRHVPGVAAGRRDRGGAAASGRKRRRTTRRRSPRCRGRARRRASQGGRPALLDTNAVRATTRGAPRARQGRPPRRPGLRRPRTGSRTSPATRPSRAASTSSSRRPSWSSTATSRPRRWSATSTAMTIDQAVVDALVAAAAA